MLFADFVLLSNAETYENEYGKLEVYPDISTNIIRQKQYYNATSYLPSQNMDIAFRFNDSLTYGKVYYWNGSEYVKVDVEHIEHNNKHWYLLNDIYFNQYETKHGYWEYDVPINSSGKWDMFIKRSSDTLQYAVNNDLYVHLDPWWDSSWNYKKEIVLNSSQVPSSLNNFPVCINITDTDLRDNAQANGSDIAFTDSSGNNQLNHEIEYWDSSTGELIAWVNVTSLSSSSDTSIYMYYGNSGCPNQENADDTWDDKYKLVCHGNRTGNDLWDSSGEGHHPSTMAGDPVNSSGGKGIGYYQDYDG